MKFHTTPLDEIAKRPTNPKLGEPLTAQQAMQLAIDLAWQGLGTTSPNPMVGAVALDAFGRLIGFGHHREVGGPHAEVMMWKNIQKNFPSKQNLNGDHVFVSLEPCAHAGRTPPCARLLAELHPRQVSYLLQDPNPLVAGKGAEFLRNHGITCGESPAMASQGRQQNDSFLWRHTVQSKLMVGLKAAATISGSIGTTGDRRRWITGERARAFGHFLRLRYDAIAIGATTAIQDNPTLDPSFFDGRARPPWKVVVDPRLRAADYFSNPAVTCNLLRSAPDRVIWLCANGIEGKSETVKWLEQTGVHVQKLATDAGSFSAFEMVSALAPYPVHSLLLEGGAGLYGAFLDSGFVHRIHHFTSLRLLGSYSSSINIESSRKGHEPVRLRDTELTPLGDDLLIEGWI